MLKSTCCILQTVRKLTLSYYNPCSNFVKINFSSGAVFRYCERFSSTMTSQQTGLVAVCQLSSTSDREKNFQICKSLIETSKVRGAKIVFLPECFDHVGESRKQSIELAEPLDGPLVKKYQELASLHSLWLSLGGMHEKGPSTDEDRVYNAHIIIDDKGQIVSVYRKIHLFDIDVPGGIRLKESDFTIKGSKITPPVDSPVGKIGLGICYDLRFPEFSLSLTKAGADILTYPSAFTQTTGMAHWESLLRSRAIESQCYVIAAAQTGRHNPKRTSYGNAMVVDPWGCIIACCSEGIGLVTAEINLSFVKKVREEMSVWTHRRPELYGTIPAASSCEGIPEERYMFGPYEVKPGFLFYRTQYSMASVNRKCVLPGHVLVIPIRCAKRLTDLSPIENADLFACVQQVEKVIQLEHNATSAVIAIQDGEDAGQTVPHLHVHIMPRKPGDFERNDEIYEKLATHDKGESVKWRDEQEMIEEAQKLRTYFSIA